MSFKAIVYAYVFGGITFIPLVIVGLVFFTIYTSVPVGDADINKDVKGKLEAKDEQRPGETEEPPAVPASDLNDIPRTRKGWLTMRRTFEESAFDGGYVTLVRSYLDARSKDPKRSRPKDMWYVVLKGKVLYLYEDEAMTECEAAIELGGHDVIVYPEGLLDGELFAKRNAICLKPKVPPVDKAMPSLTREMKLDSVDVDEKAEEMAGGSIRKKNKEKEKLMEAERTREVAREEALNLATPWFIFVRSNVDMEDWYLALVHASDNPANSPTLPPLQAVFRPLDMDHLVTTLDEQPDVIPMRWLNALIGRLFFSYYRTHALEAYIIGRLMRKLSKVKRPAFLTDIVVTEVSVGNTAPTFSKPMLKELTKEGDASLEVRLQYKGEVRITIEATATINLGARFKSYTVKLALAAVLREIEGNLLIKVKRPPSSRIWYAFTQTPRMVLDVEPIVSDRQITWSMILNTIEARLKEIIQESIVMPNMDDIAFFESSQYEHRGGIWNDASRRERPESTASGPVLEDNLSVTSAPLPDGILDHISEPESSELPQSHSAEELSKNSSSPLLPESVAVVRSATESDAMNSSQGSRVRRRTWLASVSSVNSVAVNEEEASTKGPDETDEPRGRTTETETPTTSRSRSTPNSGSGVVDPQDSAGSDDFLSPHSVGRSPSRHSGHSEKSSSSSPAREASSTSTDNSSASSAFSDSDSTTTVPKSPKHSARPSGSSTPTSPSFLSTLKSRAGDKQALSNSAKEAMRKWGVNWGGLKREGAGSTGSHDEMPDVGPADSRQRVDSQKGRARYADVRAAVEERKEREKAPSEPIAIPEGGRSKGRPVSMNSPSPSFSGGISASSSMSSSKGKSTSTERGTSPNFVAPSMSRTTTELQTSGNALEGSRDQIAPPDGSMSPPSPIHTQPPQAKTMTIPGIHASHRGEVMSMGYSAPSPPPPPDNKMKPPAMQSMYRLWKSPTLSGQQQQEVESQVQVQDSNEENKDVAPLSLSPSNPPLPSRPIPPPLPPRTIDPALSRSRPDTPKTAPEAPKTASGSPPTIPSPASDALKSIVSKDYTSRRASQEVDSPSPSRRASVNRESKETANDVSNNASHDSHDDLTEITPLTSPAPTKPTPPQLPPRRIQASA